MNAATTGDAEARRPIQSSHLHSTSSRRQACRDGARDQCAECRGGSESYNAPAKDKVELERRAYNEAEFERMDGTAASAAGAAGEQSLVESYCTYTRRRASGDPCDSLCMHGYGSGEVSLHAYVKSEIFGPVLPKNLVRTAISAKSIKGSGADAASLRDTESVNSVADGAGAGRMYCRHRFGPLALLAGPGWSQRRRPSIHPLRSS